MILAAQDILWAINHKQLEINPFCNKAQHPAGFSYGLNAAGYDVRIKLDKESITLKPNGFMLATTLEFIRVPDNLLVIVHDKSTWARRGIALQNTVLEPGWFGYTTLEISNHSNNSVLFEDGMPIAQFIFHRLTSATDQPYVGKYQNQEQRPVEAIMDKKSPSQ